MQVKQNPNKEVADSIKKKLKENDFYCPCKLIKTADTHCMCKEFRDMMTEKKTGWCHCKLYYLSRGDD